MEFGAERVGGSGGVWKGKGSEGEIGTCMTAVHESTGPGDARRSLFHLFVPCCITPNAAAAVAVAANRCLSVVVVVFVFDERDDGSDTSVRDRRSRRPSRPSATIYGANRGISESAEFPSTVENDRRRLARASQAIDRVLATVARVWCRTRE